MGESEGEGEGKRVCGERGGARVRESDWSKSEECFTLSWWKLYLQ